MYDSPIAFSHQCVIIGLPEGKASLWQIELAVVNSFHSLVFTKYVLCMTNSICWSWLFDGCSLTCVRVHIHRNSTNSTERKITLFIYFNAVTHIHRNDTHQILKFVENFEAGIKFVRFVCFASVIFHSMPSVPFYARPPLNNLVIKNLIMIIEND